MLRFLFLVPPLLIVCAACTTPLGRRELPDTPPDYRPPLESAEAGLWMQMDKLEQSLKTSRLLVRDPAINRYINGVVCRVAGPHCQDIRVYLVRIPEFNASMAPNGVMQVWTGLLLRAENEAQLAYVIGHEIGHYLRRHSLQQWHDVRRKSSLFAYLNVLTRVVGVPAYAQDIGQLATLGSLFKFSRDAERQADQMGSELTTAAGYDPREGAMLWKVLLKERDAEEEPSPWVFFSTHPPSEERIQTLERLAAEAPDQDRLEMIGEESYLDAVGPWWTMLLRDELRQRRFARTQVVLDRLAKRGKRLGELNYFRGELYRLRGEKDDKRKAEQAYQKALGYEGAPAETYRALGIIYLKSSDKAQARALLQRYLELKPEAEDRAMIKSYLANEE